MPGNLLLLADSRPFFVRPQIRLLTDFFSSGRDKNPQVLYIGAANGNQPEFADQAKFLMQRFLRQYRFVHLQTNNSSLSRELFDDNGFLILAGGDPENGWQFLSDSGIGTLIQNHFQNGLSVMGLSAGAMLCGSGPVNGSYLQLVPWLIGAHEESEQWRKLLNRQNQQPELDAVGLNSGSLILLSNGQLETCDTISFFAGRQNSKTNRGVYHTDDLTP